jgi:hypothetical protein
MFNLSEYLATDYSCLSLSFTDLAIVAKYCEGRDLVVELGTCMGNTAKMMSKLAKRVITIDLFEDIDSVHDQSQKDMYKNQFIGRPHYFKDISAKLLPLGNVEILQGNTAKLQCCCSTETVDTIFIDADHSYLGVKLDYEAWFVKIKVGGHFIFHDCCPDTTGVSQVWGYYLDTLTRDIRIREIDPEIKMEQNGTSIRVFQKMRS